ncbi:zinc-regulated GTPase metalloprotein activator 1C isoform X2 [Pan troglodytes]|uniref:zinc-regulated GTPase metalloprotein activator 1C isoform X2 n=1 Tax=Pan troglodytes TaxID=9598 RepID=UPI0023F36510|nr:zinc-regulated GTPase metalloprotein activator 1E isoform X3 [Pan troglodytes]
MVCLGRLGVPQLGQKPHEWKLKFVGREEPNVHLKPGVHLGSDVQLKTGIPPGAEESTQGLVLNWGLMTTRGQGAVASMFWVDAELGSDVYLDGIITIVDSKYGLKHLTEEKPDGLINEATRQVALADIILINKTDLVPEEDVKKLRTTIRSINGLGQILETQRSRVDLSNVLDLHAFDSLSGISYVLYNLVTFIVMYLFSP